MPKLEDEHNYAIVFNAADEAVVFYAITPKPSQCTAQRLAESAGIFKAGDALAKILQDGLLNSRVQLTQLAAGAVVEFDCPVFGTVSLSL